jgi:hypothetical protein
MWNSKFPVRSRVSSQYRNLNRVVIYVLTIL